METSRGSPTSTPGTPGSGRGDDGREQLRGRAEQEKARAGDTADDLAGATRAAADDLERRGEAQLADMARSAASQFSSFADSLHHRNVDDILRDARHLARTNPAVFIGGSIAVGFALARVFKSSGSAHAAETHAGAGTGAADPLRRADAPVPTAPPDPLSSTTPSRPGGAVPGTPDDLRR